MKMTTEKFIKLLKSHDWSYRYSDDPYMYRNGETSERKIAGIMEVQPEMKQIYDDYKNGKYRQ